VGLETAAATVKTKSSFAFDCIKIGEKLSKAIA
jgi:hypothetical protein